MATPSETVANYWQSYQSLSSKISNIGHDRILGPLFKMFFLPQALAVNVLEKAPKQFLHTLWR